MGKVYTRFQTKTAQKPYPMGRHILIWLIWGSTRPGYVEHQQSSCFPHIYISGSFPIFFSSLDSGHVGEKMAAGRGGEYRLCHKKRGKCSAKKKKRLTALSPLPPAPFTPRALLQLPHKRCLLALGCSMPRRISLLIPQKWKSQFNRNILDCHSSELPLILNPRGGGGTPIHYLYGYVPPNGVGISKLLV